MDNSDKKYDYCANVEVTPNQIFTLFLYIMHVALIVNLLTLYLYCRRERRRNEEHNRRCKIMMAARSINTNPDQYEEYPVRKPPQNAENGSSTSDEKGAKKKPPTKSHKRGKKGRRRH